MLQLLCSRIQILTVLRISTIQMMMEILGRMSLKDCVEQIHLMLETVRQMKMEMEFVMHYLQVQIWQIPMETAFQMRVTFSRMIRRLHLTMTMMVCLMTYSDSLQVILDWLKILMTIMMVGWILERQNVEATDLITYLCQLIATKTGLVMELTRIVMVMDSIISSTTSLTTKLRLQILIMMDYPMISMDRLPQVL